MKLADNAVEVETKATKILGMEIKGNTVEKILVCDAAPIAKEYYLGMVLDRSRQGITLMLTDQGGVDIEELAVKDPDAIHKMTLYPHLPIDEAHWKQAIEERVPQKALDVNLEAFMKGRELFGN